VNLLDKQEGEGEDPTPAGEAVEATAQPNSAATSAA
jgi:hypothetical protein